MKRIRILMVCIALVAARVWANDEDTLPVPIERRAQPGIFVPAPKGAGETLDEADVQGVACDIVTTRQRDRLHGTVVGIEPGGKLRFSGPQFQGEVTMLASSLDKALLQSSVKDTGSYEVLITNGDKILGDLKTITSDAVVIESASAGILKIPLKVVSSIKFAEGADVLVEGDFKAGIMGPWKKSGQWTLTQDGLFSGGGEDTPQLFAALEQKQALTFEASVKHPEGNSLDCYLMFMAGAPTTGGAGFPENCIFAYLNGNSCNFGCVQDGSVMNNGERSFPFVEGTLRFGYDPDTGKAMLWCNAHEVGGFLVPNKPQSGKYVVFRADSPCQVASLRVFSGIVPPPAEAERLKDAENVQFVNRDRATADAVTLAEGMLNVATHYGELHVPAEKVHSVSFRTKGRENPVSDKNDAKVQTNGSLWTLQVERLDKECLVGSSAYLGPVKLNRAAVRAIQFNVSK